METNNQTQQPQKPRISRNVFILGLVSFFNDMASEMVYPLIPIFLTTILGAPITIVGLIEGIAESSGNIFKILFGWFSDKLQKRNPFTVIGYLLSAVSKILLGLSFACSCSQIS